jgi:hypothetical protein
VPRTIRSGKVTGGVGDGETWWGDWRCAVTWEGGSGAGRSRAILLRAHPKPGAHGTEGSYEDGTRKRCGDQKGARDNGIVSGRARRHRWNALWVPAPSSGLADTYGWAACLCPR